MDTLTDSGWLQAHYDLEALCERSEGLVAVEWGDDTHLMQAAMAGLSVPSMEGMKDVLSSTMKRIRELFEKIWELMKSAGRRFKKLFDRTEKRRQETEEQLKTHSEKTWEDVEVRFQEEARGREADIKDYQAEVDGLKARLDEYEERQEKQAELMDEICEMLEIAIQDARDSKNPDVQRRLDEMFEGAVLESVPPKVRNRSPMDRRVQGDVVEELYVLDGVGRRTKLGKLTRRNGKAIGWKESWVKDFRHEKYERLSKLHASNLDSLIELSETVGTRLKELEKRSTVDVADRDTRRLFRRIEDIGEKLETALKTESFPADQAPAIRSALLRMSRVLRLMTQNATENVEGTHAALAEAVENLSKFEAKIDKQ